MKRKSWKASLNDYQVQKNTLDFKQVELKTQQDKINQRDPTA